MNTSYWNGYKIPEYVTRYNKKWTLQIAPQSSEFKEVSKSRVSAEKRIGKMYKYIQDHALMKVILIIVPITKKEKGKKEKIYCIYYRLKD